MIDKEEEAEKYIVMEYIKNGVIGGKKFWKFRNKNKGKDKDDKKLETEELQHYFSQMILGLDHSNLLLTPVHKLNIAHRDIKPDNILVSANNEIKITDFGVSEVFKGKSDLSQNRRGTVAFHPPELYNSKQPLKATRRDQGVQRQALRYVGARLRVLLLDSQ